MAAPGFAAYISEIDLGGPAGRGIEFSAVSPSLDYTLLIIDANPYSTSAFGTVLDVIHLPAGSGRAGVAMVTELAWPDNTALTQTLASLAPASGSSLLNFDFARLLVVMQGFSSVKRFDRPLVDAAAQSRYASSTPTDYLVLADGNPQPLYLSRGHDISQINAGLGIDLLGRLVDKNAGQVIARTGLPGQPVEMDVFFAGNPDAARQFEVATDYVYTYTPSMNNLPLTALAPEPNSAALWLLFAGWCLRRRR